MQFQGMIAEYERAQILELSRRGKRHRAQWLIYNLFMRKASQTENISSIVAPTAEPDVAPMPPILPVKREWRAAVLEAARGPGPHLS